MNVIQKLIEYASDEDLGDGGYAGELAWDARIELARLQRIEAEHDKSILQLMDEIEMRHGDNAKRWEELRKILEDAALDIDSG